MLNSIITVLPIKESLATSFLKIPIYLKVLFYNNDFFYALWSIEPTNQHVGILNQFKEEVSSIKKRQISTSKSDTFI